MWYLIVPISDLCPFSYYDDVSCFPIYVYMFSQLLGDFGGLCFVCSKGKLCILSDSNFNKDKVCWMCSNGKCHKKLSIKEGSWFSKSNLLLEQIVKLTYYTKTR